MNPKLIKTIEQIEKNTAKIAQLQTATKKLIAQRTLLENEEIVSAVRTGSITDLKDIQRLLNGEAILQVPKDGSPAVPVVVPAMPETKAFDDTTEEDNEDE